MKATDPTKRFPLGCSTVVFRPEPVCEGHFRAFAEAGIEFIELTCVHKYVDFHDRRLVNRVVQSIADCELTAYSVHAPFYDGVDLSSIDEEGRRSSVEEVCLALDIAARLGARVLVVHCAPEVKDAGERQARLGAVGRSLAELAERCAKHDIRLAAELLPRYCLGNCLDEMLRIVEPLDPQVVGVCLDVNHANLRDDLAQATRRLGARIASLHISDNDGVDERHWPPFKGVIDWKLFADALRATPFRGPFMYEVCFQDDDAPPYAQRFEILRDRYRRVWSCG